MGLRPTIPELGDLIAEARLGGKISLAVADARTGRMLEVHDPRSMLPPASVAKAMTALYALDALGPSYRFRTRIIATGPLDAGVLQGDLVLVGGGDPTLDTDVLGDLAAELRAIGLRRVAGRFLYYDAALPPISAIDPGQPDHLGYNPAVSGLNLNFNRVHFEWRRAQGAFDISMEARAERYSPEVAMARMRIIDRATPVFTYSGKGRVEDWTVARGALGKHGSRWLPVRRPALYAAEVFATLARARGISLGKIGHVEMLPKGQELASFASAPLPEVIRDMLLYSTNLTAEVTGLSATLANKGKVRDLAGSARMMNAWANARLDTQRVGLVDHSGLGDRSNISAEDMVRALRAAGADGMLRKLMKPVYLKDAEGKTIKNGPVQIRAKTGSLNFVSSLAGYVRTPGGRDLTFAIFSADEPRRAALSRAQRERPKGGKSWSTRARDLQLQLLARWAAKFDRA